MAELRTTSLFHDANLQGYWRCEGNLLDSGPNGYDLTNHSSSDSSDGKYGNGRDFEADSSNYAERAFANIANLIITGSQTWVCWVKPETLVSYEIPMSLANSDGSNTQGIFLSADSGGIVYFTLLGLTTNSQVNSGATTLTPGVRVHIAGVYSSASSKLRIYINGVKVGELTASGSATAIIDGGFALGGRGGAASGFLDGILDEAAIFDRALTDAEILNLASDPGTTTSTSTSTTTTSTSTSTTSTSTTSSSTSTTSTSTTTTSTSSSTTTTSTSTTSTSTTSTSTTITHPYNFVIENVGQS